jgi:hypothetical protein
MGDIPLMEIFDSKKFMWDGQEYATKEAAEEAAARYKADRFDTHVLAVGSAFAVYSRRAVAEVQVAG